MLTNRKNALFLSYSILLCSIFAHSINLPSISHNSSASDLLQMNKINHNFNFSVTSHFDGLSSRTLYSLGDQISYSFSDKLSFVGNVNANHPILQVNIVYIMVVLCNGQGEG